ncbi:hypothetical protein [Streptosporangium sp. CA-115845]
MIIEEVRKTTDYITVIILLAIVAAIVDSFARDWRKGWRPWHWDSWRNP